MARNPFLNGSYGPGVPSDLNGTHEHLVGIRRPQPVGKLRHLVDLPTTVNGTELLRSWTPWQVVKNMSGKRQILQRLISDGVR